MYFPDVSDTMVMQLKKITRKLTGKNDIATKGFMYPQWTSRVKAVHVLTLQAAGGLVLKIFTIKSSVLHSGFYELVKSLTKDAQFHFGLSFR